ncbi:MAG: 2-hydroxychromene-2-carboxylate isomerase [Betaproteobacteria bacterium]|nr:2-hydroxychromene-2-carboxylate isomerase [Betaproteobacteria bacterium]
MAAPLEFYFDFSSPYAYLASEKIDELAAKYGRKVQWHPILLGVVFKATGGAPLTEIPFKGDYSRRDFDRSARYLGLPFRFPSKFPQATQVAARAYYWLHERDCITARAFAHAAFRALFMEDRDLSDPALVRELAVRSGAERAALEAGLQDDGVKARLRQECDAAIGRGVFGAPFFFVDGEPFWGADRLPQIEKWLAEGKF